MRLKQIQILLDVCRIVYDLISYLLELILFNNYNIIIVSIKFELIQCIKSSVSKIHHLLTYIFSLEKILECIAILLTDEEYKFSL